MRCDECGKKLEGNSYISDYTKLCEECGDFALTYNDSLDAYVFAEDDEETFYDDESSNIEVFELKVI